MKQNQRMKAGQSGHSLKGKPNRRLEPSLFNNSAAEAAILLLFQFIIGKINEKFQSLCAEEGNYWSTHSEREII